MGYNTVFQGAFELSKNLNGDQAEYLNQFLSTRHVKYNVELLPKVPQNLIENGVIDSWGEDGMFFTNPEYDWCKRNCHKNPIFKDYNFSPEDVPGLWCQWKIDVNENGNHILCWSGGEKFYSYDLWLQFLIDYFFIPWEIELDGHISYVGEKWKTDFGTICVWGDLVYLDHNMTDEIEELQEEFKLLYETE